MANSPNVNGLMAFREFFLTANSPNVNGLTAFGEFFLTANSPIRNEKDKWRVFGCDLINLNFINSPKMTSQNFYSPFEKTPFSRPHGCCWKAFVMLRPLTLFWMGVKTTPSPSGEKCKKL